MGAIFNLLSGGLLGKIVDGVSGFLTKRAEGKQAAAAVAAKIQLATVNKDAKLELADHEIQVLRTQNAGSSWKDEYVTLLVSVPILVSILGTLVSILFPDTGARILSSAEQIKDLMTGNSIDYAELWLIVVATALGTKPFRK